MNAKVTYEKKLSRGRFVVYDDQPDFNLIKIKQTHSSIVLLENECDGNATGDGIYGETNTPKAILTADCVPIVVLGKDGHVTIHAGWRGLAQNILASPLVKKIQPQYAFIGPHIRRNYYEVQKDFLSNFPLHQDAFYQDNDRIIFDMAQVTSAQLNSLYPSIKIEDCNLCTFFETKFHSYRRNKTDKRNWNIYFPT